MAQRVEKALSFLGSGRRVSSANLLAEGARGGREFPTSADDYELLEECGRGVSATVWRAVCKTLNEEVAVKLLDLENMNCSLEEIIREAQTMRQLLHHNVLQLYCSFVHKEQLWMVMPYVSGGSVLNIMKYAFPEGLEEAVIATILKEVLKGLEYIHRTGCIHRDIKAGNILIDRDGQVYLADFGVAASMERTGSWGNTQASRSTFVGTPCWMAPEIMEQAQGYGPLADIWSFGITILELAHGHAPFARLPPMKVLLMTIQNPPPTLDSDSGKKHFSKAMRDIVAKCLIKDPTKRPTAAQLLEHKFFKTAHDASYLVKHLLAGLPPLPERVRQMRTGSAVDVRAQAVEAARSAEAYVKGVSSWNFDVAALKEQALAEGLADVSKTPALSTVLEGIPLGSTPSTSSSNLPSTTEGVAAPAALPPTANGMAPAPALAVAAPPVPVSPAGKGLTLDTAAAPAATSLVRPPPVVASPSTHQRSSSAERVGTPGRLGSSADGRPPLSANTSFASRTSSASGKTLHQKKGRFEVYEEGGLDGGEELQPGAPQLPVTAAAVLTPASAPSATDLVASTSDAAATVGGVAGAAAGEGTAPGGLPASASGLGAGTPALPASGSGLLVTSSSGLPALPKPPDGAEPDKAKRKGRFHIVEEDVFGDKRTVPRSSSTASMGEGPYTTKSGVPAAGGSSAQPAGMLLGPLKEMLEAMHGPYELLKELVVAVGDSERGKPHHLTTLIQERLTLRATSKEDAERLRGEVSQLKEENAKLREKMRLLESKLQRIQLESQTPAPSPPRPAVPTSEAKADEPAS